VSKCQDCGQDHTAGPVVFKLKPVDGRELARTFAGTAVDMLSRPSFRAGIIGSAVVGALCSRAGMRPAPALVLMIIAHGAAERLWDMAEDIHETAVAQRDHLAKHADAEN
jgi:hypothetical protein